jgi:hypothetical protein
VKVPYFVAIKQYIQLGIILRQGDLTIQDEFSQFSGACFVGCAVSSYIAIFNRTVFNIDGFLSGFVNKNYKQAIAFIAYRGRVDYYLLNR